MYGYFSSLPEIGHGEMQIRHAKWDGIPQALSLLFSLVYYNISQHQRSTAIAFTDDQEKHGYSGKELTHDGLLIQAVVQNGFESDLHWIRIEKRAKPEGKPEDWGLPFRLIVHWNDLYLFEPMLDPVPMTIELTWGARPYSKDSAFQREGERLPTIAVLPPTLGEIRFRMMMLNRYIYSMEMIVKLWNEILKENDLQRETEFEAYRAHQRTMNSIIQAIQDYISTGQWTDTYEDYLNEKWYPLKPQDAKNPNDDKPDITLPYRDDRDDG